MGPGSTVVGHPGAFVPWPMPSQGRRECCRARALALLSAGARADASRGGAVSRLEFGSGT